MLTKYANLLTRYCLDLKANDRVYVSSTYLAEPLLQEVFKAALELGAHPILHVDIDDTDRLMLQFANPDQLAFVNPLTKEAMGNFEAYLNIRAPFNMKSLQGIDNQKMKLRQDAMKGVNKAYFERTASGAMRRSLCQFPTQAAAQEAGMSLSEHQRFVYSACRLDEDDPVAAWLEVRQEQQRYVDYLNKCSNIHYQSTDVDITFSCKGRTWINSDGRANMPSGEVFTGPVEGSVNGRIKFTYPAIVMGNEVEGVELVVKDGRVESWSATRGKDFLDHIFTLDGARYFGEVAVGTNYRIQRFTKNILFDEKIGGTIHMAIGQSYIQTGGKNQSPIHIDLIADMKNGGTITADGEVIYRDGKFVI